MHMQKKFLNINKDSPAQGSVMLNFFYERSRKSTFVWAPSAGTTELCTNFFNAQIKCFGEKDVMNEIKK